MWKWYSSVGGIQNHVCFNLSTANPTYLFTMVDANNNTSDNKYTCSLLIGELSIASSSVKSPSYK